MAHSSSTLYFLISLSVLIRTYPSLALYCYNTTGNFKSSSPYEKNRGAVLSSLASNVAAHNGFYTTSTGENPNTIYAITFCRGDSSADTCASCVSSAVQDLVVKCPNQKAVFSLGNADPPCFIRHSDTPIYGILQTSPTYKMANIGNHITMNQDQFDKVGGNLTQRLVNKAADGSSRLKYVTGQAGLPDNKTIYSLLHSPDLLPNDCGCCLSESIDDYYKCRRGWQGGYVYKPSCNFRWELHKFFESSPSPFSSSPPPSSLSHPATPPAPRENIAKGTLAAIISSVAVFVLLLFISCCYLRRRPAEKEYEAVQEGSGVSEITSLKSLQFDWDTLLAATNNFSQENKLGRGGFGKVYQGRLPNGQEIAVKRLSQSSKQGVQEFMNEIVLVVKLQHQNLVRLLKFCLEGEEKLLIYKFVPNKSLDYFVFEDGSYVSSSTLELKKPASTMSAQPPPISPFLLRLPSVLLCLLILMFDLSNAQHCYDTGNFTATSNYAKNRELVLSSLPSDVASNGGFYSGKVGNSSDVVYVLSFCRGDSSNDSCFKCLSSAAEDLIIKCPNQKAAVTWGTGDPPCIIRYADGPMYGVKQAFPTLQYYNTGNITMDQDQFDRTWRNFTEELATRASMGTSELKFIAGRTVLPNTQNMFALLQCSPDLSQIDCRVCLWECINDYQDCCHGKQGGGVNKPSCIFRWDLYPFFQSDPINLLPSPPPPTVVTKADPAAPPPANAQVTNGNISKSLRIVVAVIGSAALFVVIIVSVCCLIRRRRSNPLMVSSAKDEVKTAESLQFKISEIRAATNSFAEGNKLGEGGFGKVYRGRLPNGQEIAVKRLSQSSRQGLQEFKNEIVLVAKLQHRNLVRLLGFCFEEGEKLLVYELMPNKSLDYFMFDPEKSKQLDWPRRYNIISGIARGMLYLHEDSRLRIIHRDLKASNILVDNNMNPKISDFGMARIFGVDQTNASTRRIVGTYGYMSPEYAMHGQFSQKSDVYSFGVLLLEIICGKRNDYYCQSDGGEALASYAWKHWRDNVPWEILDPVLGKSYSRSQVLRCIHIGFLCVQEDPADRPTMASIVLALSSQTLSLPVPREPAFFLRSWTEPPKNIIANDQGHDQNTSGSTPLSVNGVSITELSAR